MMADISFAFKSSKSYNSVFQVSDSAFFASVVITIASLRHSSSCYAEVSRHKFLLFSELAVVLKIVKTFLTETNDIPIRRGMQSRTPPGQSSREDL